MINLQWVDREVYCPSNEAIGCTFRSGLSPTCGLTKPRCGNFKVSILKVIVDFIQSIVVNERTILVESGEGGCFQIFVTKLKDRAPNTLSRRGHRLVQQTTRSQIGADQRHSCARGD